MSIPRRHLIALTVLASTCTAHDAAAQWIPNGALVAGGPSYQVEAKACTDEAGGVFVVWRDERVSAADVFMQHVLASGEIAPGWPIDGLAVCTAYDNQWAAKVAPDGQGGALVVWEDNRDYFTTGVDIYAQRVTADGAIAPGWPIDGVAISAVPGDEAAPLVAADGGGGAFVAWSDHRLDVRQSDAYIHHFDVGGRPSPGWPANGRPLANGPTPEGTAGILPDGAGGLFIVWLDAPYPTYVYASDIHASRITSSGEPAPGWPPSGVPISLGPWPKGSFGECSDGDGGLFYAWEDYRTAPQSEFPTNDFFYADIYAQHVTADGQIPPGWPATGLPVCTLPYAQWDLHFCPDTQGGLLLAWEDYRTFVEEDMYVQRVTGSGQISPGWPENGRLVSIAPGYQLNPAISPDGQGGAFIAYSDLTATYRLSAQHLTGIGTIASGWSESGTPLCVTPGNQQEQVMVPADMMDAIVVWTDSRDHSNQDLYAQRLVGDGPVPTLLSLVSADARPDRVVLTWFAADAAGLVANVYRRTTSSDWQRLDSVVGDGGGGLRYEDRNVIPGARYAYRLGYSEGGRETFTVETWVIVPSEMALTLDGLRPNPAVGAMVASFSLPSAERATLELVDLNGRRMIAQEVGSLGAGRHLVRFNQGETVPAGMYWLRLRQGPRTLVARGAVIR